MVEPVRFVHVSDSHLLPDGSGEVRGVRTLARLETLVREIDALPFVPAFVVHTGDVVNDAEDDPEAAYALATAALSRLRWPLHVVPGNHDAPALSRAFPPPLDALPLGDGHAYSFAVGGHVFAVLDARLPGSQGAAGTLPATQLDRLARILDGDFETLSVFVHYPPLGLDSPWIEAGMRLTNGAELHALLAAAVRGGRRIGGVFFGHVHRDVAALADGVLYSAVASPCFHFSGWPTDALEPLIEPEGAVHLSVVAVAESGTVIKGFSAPVSHGPGI